MNTQLNAIFTCKQQWNYPELNANWRINKMGAYKNLVIEVADNMYQISRDLNQASETSDFDEMKRSLRSAIVNSALVIAQIQELER